MKRPYRPAPDRHAPVILWIAALCAVPEVLLTLLGTPLFGLQDLRRVAIMLGAFWPGLLGDWQPVFPGQRAAMFFSYAFLHAGFLHLLFNMLMVLHLGREAVMRLGQAGFLLLYMVSAAGGAAGFALLSASPGPMVGASGAVFGLFGATQFWDFQRRRAARASLRPFWQLMAGLILMNLVLVVMAGGMLAWQAHLGGYIAGFAIAWTVTPTRHHRFRGFD
ncbi:MAG TPA: rhomboid family intramembrane serine protease [Paracoccus sp.]|nr:rhomboid family intramembrane serine protease [Paracoccus sp. (in: a-proteobacteria)]